MIPTKIGHYKKTYCGFLHFDDINKDRIDGKTRIEDKICHSINKILIKQTTEICLHKHKEKKFSKVFYLPLLKLEQIKSTGWKSTNTRVN